MLPVVFPVKTTPLLELGIAVVPARFVPIWLPWIRLPEASVPTDRGVRPTIWMPEPAAPEITLVAVVDVPPTVLPTEPFSISTLAVDAWVPASPADPSEFSPIVLPTIRLFEAPTR